MTKRTVPEARWDENRQYWRVNVQMDGTRKTFYEKTEGRRGKRICEAKAQDWLDSNAPDDLRFDAAVERYLASKKLTVRNSSYDQYVIRFRNHLLPVLGRKRLSQITPQSIQDIINKMAADGYSHSTCDAVRTAATDFSRWARKARLEMDRLEDIDIPERAWTGERNPLQPEHLTVLFADTPANNKNWYINAFRFDAILGLRRGELCGLRWDDIQDGVLTVSRSVNVGEEITEPKTKQAYRKIFLPGHALKILEDQKAKLAKYHCISPYIFPSKIETGTVCNPKALLSCWKSYCKKNGFPEFCLHELRHTAISMYKSDMPEELLKGIVGHSVHMDTYKVYGHEFGNDAQRAAATIDQVLTGVLREAK